MSIGIGIIGLEQSGKTSVFNALTRAQNHNSTTTPPDKAVIGTAKVPDVRLQILTNMFNPERVTQAEVQYVDVSVDSQRKKNSGGISGTLTNTLQKTDAILIVVRAFESPSVPHPEGTVDPYRDFSTMSLELSFSDLAILERKGSELQKRLKAAKSSEKDKILKESEIIVKIKSGLESDIPIRDQDLSEEERNSISDYQFLTDKPLLVLFNIGEDQLDKKEEIEQEISTHIRHPSIESTTMCGKLETELAQMEPDEENQFREFLNAGESGSEKIIRLSYEMLGLSSFFTVGSDEVKAWTININQPAGSAARRIHSDIERGFIRAEVVSFDDLSRLGGLIASRKEGVLRSEGRTYPVKDGDVINFLFNI